MDTDIPNHQPFTAVQAAVKQVIYDHFKDSLSTKIISEIQDAVNLPLHNLLRSEVAKVKLQLTAEKAMATGENTEQAKTITVLEKKAADLKALLKKVCEDGKEHIAQLKAESDRVWREGSAQNSKLRLSLEQEQTRLRECTIQISELESKLEQQKEKNLHLLTLSETDNYERVKAENASTLMEGRLRECEVQLAQERTAYRDIIITQDSQPVHVYRVTEPTLLSVILQKHCDRHTQERWQDYTVHRNGEVTKGQRVDPRKHMVMPVRKSLHKPCYRAFHITYNPGTYSGRRLSAIKNKEYDDDVSDDYSDCDDEYEDEDPAEANPNAEWEPPSALKNLKRKRS